MIGGNTNGRGAPDSPTDGVRGAGAGVGLEGRDAVTQSMGRFLDTQAQANLRLLVRAYGDRAAKAENQVDALQAEIRRLRGRCCDLENECPHFQDGYAAGVEMGELSARREAGP